MKKTTMPPIRNPEKKQPARMYVSQAGRPLAIEAMSLAFADMRVGGVFLSFP